MIEIRLLEDCNMKCVFCHIPQLKPKKLDLDQVILLLRSIDHSKVQRFTITGGEPTMVPYLSKLLKIIKKLNINHIVRLQTNGLMFSNYTFLEKIVSSGLDGMLLSFHSQDRDIFEKITKAPGSYDKLIVALKNLKRFNLNIEISYVLCEYNHKDLFNTFKFLNDNLNFNSALIANIFEKINYENKNDYTVNISKITEELSKTLEFLKQNGKKITTCGVPMCYLGGYESTYMVGQYEENRYFKKDEKCEKCLLNDYCRGLIGDYTTVYGTGELKPVLKVDQENLKKVIKRKEFYEKSNFLNYNNSTS